MTYDPLYTKVMRPRYAASAKRAHAAWRARNREKLKAIRAACREKTRKPADVETVGLKELAAMMELAVSTLQTSWKKRRDKGQIPPEVGGYGRPRFNREAVKAYLSGQRPEKEKGTKPRQNRRAASAAAEMAAAMAADR
ncbi:hypothetical protein [Asticcacaulis taihuensis]|uniref:hypothetical protein n=1 Tax=Asticcacaulis taihuensis TaxID=260084 RepID=UPI0026EF3486|nr:hypothetical protein [Asticcacaulis taihuensis]